jgi:hypothetical protein
MYNRSLRKLCMKFIFSDTESDKQGEWTKTYEGKQWTGLPSLQRVSTRVVMWSPLAYSYNVLLSFSSAHFQSSNIYFCSCYCCHSLHHRHHHWPPIPVAAQSKAWAFGRALLEIVVSNPASGVDVCLLWVFVCCQVEVSVTGRSLVQRSPIECGVSECDLETSKRRQPRHNLGCCATGKKNRHLPTVPWPLTLRADVIVISQSLPLVPTCSQQV